MNDVDHEVGITDAVESVRIRSPIRFAWLGEPSPPLFPRAERAITERSARSYLVVSLTDRLYRDFYVTGGPVPMRADELTGQPDPDLVEMLREANQGTGTWDRGWRLAAVNGSQVSVVKDGLTLLAPRAACSRTRSLAPGMEVSIRYPKELVAFSPGYYLALGDRTWPQAGGAVRLYWHVGPTGAVALVRELTADLNGARIPFRLKVADHPASDERCDTGVLYLPRRWYGRALTVVRRAHATVAPLLLDGVPALTHPVAHGVAMTEDPPRSTSFGEHRCRLIAEGIVRANEAGRRSLAARVEAVLEVFREAGLDTSRPYLNPGSSFAPEPFAP